jgi:hypothetical protein
VDGAAETRGELRVGKEMRTSGRQDRSRALLDNAVDGSRALLGGSVHFFFCFVLGPTQSAYLLYQSTVQLAYRPILTHICGKIFES